MFDWKSARATVELISGKWTLLLIAELAEGSRGHNDLARSSGLDHRALDRTLSQMEDSGLIEREVRTQRPLRVRYALTPAALSLISPLDSLARWRPPHSPIP